MCSITQYSDEKSEIVINPCYQILSVLGGHPPKDWKAILLNSKLNTRYLAFQPMLGLRIRGVREESSPTSMYDANDR